MAGRALHLSSIHTHHIIYTERYLTYYLLPHSTYLISGFPLNTRFLPPFVVAQGHSIWQGDTCWCQESDKVASPSSPAIILLLLPAVQNTRSPCCVAAKAGEQTDRQTDDSGQAVDDQVCVSPHRLSWGLVAGIQPPEPQIICPQLCRQRASTLSAVRSCLSTLGDKRQVPPNVTSLSIHPGQPIHLQCFSRVLLSGLNPGNANVLEKIPKSQNHPGGVRLPVDPVASSSPESRRHHSVLVPHGGARHYLTHLPVGLTIQ